MEDRETYDSELTTQATTLCAAECCDVVNPTQVRDAKSIELTRKLQGRER